MLVRHLPDFARRGAHNPRHGDTSPRLGRVGSQERPSHEACSILGKLGGPSPHGEGQTQSTMVTPLTDGNGPPSLVSAESARRDLAGVMEFAPPTWFELARGARPPSPPADSDPSDWRTGWQHEAASRVEAHHRASVPFPHLRREGESVAQVTERTSGRSAFFHSPKKLRHPFGAAPVQGFVAPPTSLATPPHSSPVSMWPPPGPLWPPSRSVRAGRYVGKTGVCRRDCSRQGVS